MIIIFSNRCVDDSRINPFSGVGASDFFGDELSADEGREIRMAEAGYDIAGQDEDVDEDGELDFDNVEIRYTWSLKPVDKGGEAAALAELADRVRSGELDKRWVFFVHGNNQTIDKNLEKCRRLQMTHNANVIAFSWPSWASIFSKSMLKVAGKEISIAGDLSRINPLFLFGKSAIEGKKTAYQTAVGHAANSPDALASVLRMVNEHFVEALRNDGLSLNLIAHGLGNRVLQHLSRSDGIPCMFDNAILHQADVDSAGHADWVARLTLSRQLYITHNRRDSVLHISDLFAGNRKRLGHAVGDTRAANVTAYIDYSAGRQVGQNHGLYLMQGFQNQPLCESFTRLLSGEALFRDGELMEGFEHPGNEAQVIALRGSKPVEEQTPEDDSPDSDDPFHGMIDWDNVG